MSENKNEKTQERSKQEEQSIGILKKISQLNERNKKRLEWAGILLASLALSAVITVVSNNIANKNRDTKPVNSYTVVQPGDEDVTGTNGNVKFDAFFLQNNNGVAEGVRGAAREVGQQATLYMELNVMTEGYLKDAVITINGENFYLATVLPKDSEIKNNYIGVNIDEIELNQINNGTQKLIMGVVRSGDYTYTSGKTSAIGRNINNYSRNDNTVVLTGTYVDGQGHETEITKTVYLTVDWYGITRASIYNYSESYNTYSDIENRIDTTNETLTLDFNVRTEETAKELNIYKNHVEGTIPQLNGYDPISVTTTTSGVDFTYNPTTRKFTIERTAEVDSETGNITKTVATSNTYGIRVVYPLEAYESIGEEQVTIQIPVTTYYDGYNNPGADYTNPYRSNVAGATITATYRKPQGTVAKIDIEVGKLVTTPTRRYLISKQKPLKIYNGLEVTEEDTYQVKWYAYTGSDGASTGLVLKETANGAAQQAVDQFIKSDTTQDSMENITTNVGIYFTGAENFLGADGEIKVYDDETNILLATFTKNGANGTLKWGAYSSSKPYRYEYPVKHIRIETSATNASASLTVYNVKALDDDYITSNYTRAQFDELSYIKSNLVGYLGGTSLGTDTHQAIYEAPYSVATIAINPDALSTQETEENAIITITAEENVNVNKIGWLNGSYLVKLPAEIVDIGINSVTISNNNVSITSYEVQEREISGSTVRFIKINTENNSDTEQSYTITINCNITPDPRTSTVNRTVDLYASNEAGVEYYYQTADIYDVNDNTNVAEQVNYRTTAISLVSPNSLMTNQIITNFDGAGTTVVSPEIANVNPEYADIDNTQREATIGVYLKNNYASTISEVVVIGKIPFTNNTTVLSNRSLGSDFTTAMKNTGITVPNALQSSVTVYYSTNTNPTNDLSNPSNGWTTAQNVTNWANIRSYAIDFGNTVLNPQDEYTFYYTVELPTGLQFNQVSYSHHGVYFALDTEDGKYRTQTEPNKIGLRIAEKYNLELTKYQTGKNRTVEGATYSITEVEIDSNTSEITYIDTKTATTDSNGEITLTGLYAEKTYLIREIKTPTDYELNSDVIIFIAHVNRSTGVLTVQKISGTTKGSIVVVAPSGGQTAYTVQIAVEDEAKAKLHITKKEAGTVNTIQGVSYRLTGEGLPTNGRRLTTNASGEIDLSGLTVGEDYTLEEIKAPSGYYINSDPIEFKIINNAGTYQLQVKDANDTYQTVGAGSVSGHPEIATTSITTTNDLPTINLTLEDEPIPTYTLQLTKIEHVTTIDGEQNNQATTYLAGAKFRLYKDGKQIGEYITDSNGQLTITNLYQYIEGKDLEGTYVLREILPPSGYVPVKDITFTVDGTAKYADSSEDLEFIETLTDGQTAKQYTINGTTIGITVEDNPIFKIVKTDGETDALLANVKFAIYNVDLGEEPARNSKGEILGTKETINGKEYYVVTTNASGEVSLDLPEGIYKAVEVQADAKYDITGKTYYFGIGASREPQMTTIVDWATSTGGDYDDWLCSVTTTKDGGYVAVGYFDSSNISVGGYTLTNAGSAGSFEDGMIIKYNAEGEVDWARSIGGIADDRLWGGTETSDGGYIAVGEFASDTITNGVGSDTLTKAGTGSTDAMIIKYNSDGTVAWARSAGATTEDCFNAVTATEDGGCVAVGYFNTTFTVGGETLTSVGGTDGMVIKYSSNGTVVWARVVGGTGADRFTGVTATDGGFVAVGYFASATITIGSDTLTRAGTSSNDAMIVKYNTDGTVAWARGVGGTSEDRFQGVTATDGGYIAVGYFNDTFTIENYTLSHTGSTSYSDGMIIKFDEDGNVEGADKVQSTFNDRLKSVTVTANGEFAVIGEFTSSTFTVQDYLFTNHQTNFTDVMIIKYKQIEIPTVYTNTAQSMGDNLSDSFQGVTATADGGYVAVGSFNSTSFTVGNDTLTTAGDKDAIIVKYNEYGTVEWARSAGGANDDRFYGVTATSDGGYVAVGDFYSTSITAGGYTFNSNSSTSYTDAVIVKYNEYGTVEWARSAGGTNNALFFGVTATSDGGYVAVGEFRSRNISVGGYTLTNAGGDVYSNFDGMIIKYNSEGEVEWARNAGGENNDEFTGVAATSDGGCVAVGDFYSSSITVGGYTLTNTNSSNGDGMIIKYNTDGTVEWASSIRANKNKVARFTGVTATEDGGCVAVGYFMGDFIVGDYSFPSTGDYAGIIVKYSSEGEVKFAQVVGGSQETKIRGVGVTEDGGYVAVGTSYSTFNIGGYRVSCDGAGDGIIIKYSANNVVDWAGKIGGAGTDFLQGAAGTNDGGWAAVGYFNSSTIEYEGYTLTNVGGNDALLIKQTPIYGAAEMTELEVENNRKEYKITTDVKEIDGIKGGTISGEDRQPYEKVKHGDDSTQSIVMTPDTDYEIISITVNGEPYTFTPELDDTYTMPDFTNVTEDKHVVVTYSLKANKITINKVDKNTSAPLTGATFRLDQIEERNEPNQNVIGSLTDNSDDFWVTVNKQTDEVTGVLGSLTDNSAIFNPTINLNDEISGVLGEIVNDGTYNFIGTGFPYTTNTRTNGSATATSYIPLDLTNKTGTYYVQIKAQASGSFSGYGYAHITTTTSIPSRTTTANRVFYTQGSGLTTEQTYTSVALQGGQTYYIHLGCYKSNANANQLSINDIKVYGAQGDTYNFIETNGVYESTNQGVGNTTSNSYIPLDLTGETGKFELVVNANVSSQASYDFGYVTITESTARVAHGTTSNVNRLIHIAGTTTAVTTPKDYSTVLDGGKMYYIHLGYYKNASTDQGDDKFTVNSINVYRQTLFTYNFIETNGVYESTNQGKPNTTSNSYVEVDLTGLTGKYYITVNAQVSSQSSDYGYVTLSDSPDRPAYNTTTGVTRFIYISGTTTYSTPADYTIEVDGGSVYYLHLGYYKNASTDQGSDKFTVNSITVTLSDSEIYHTEVSTNNEGQAITQIPFGKYMVTEIETPEGYFTNDSIADIEFRSDANAVHEFTIQDEKIAKITVHHYIKNTTTSVAEDEEYEGYIGEEYITQAHFDLARYELEIDNNDEYVLPLNREGEFTHADQVITYYYVPRQIPLTVHHYIEGTETPVPLLDGTPAEDVITRGNEHASYTTSAIADVDLSADYELASTPANATGTYEYDEVEVTYYYKPVVRTLTINKLDEDGETPLAGAKFAVNDTNKITAIGSMTNNGTYYFVKDEDGYVPNNIGTSSGTTANSYIKIDMSEATQSTTVTINATQSGAHSYGVARITQDTTTLTYSSSTGRFMYLYTTATARDYTTTLQPGNVYYLHLQYYISPSTGVSDTFRINSITIDGASPEYITDSNGQIQLDLPPGEYVVTELEPPANHTLPAVTTTNVEITKTSTNVVNIVNSYTKGTVVVHHYIENTTTPVPSNVSGETVEDETKTGNVGSTYATQPATNISSAYRCINSNPANASGTYIDGTITVIYYYAPNSVEITTAVNGTGGTISGQNQTPYETVNFGGTSTLPIVATPSSGYFVSTIEVNGVPIAFTPAADGTVTLAQFTNMTENKHVVVTFEQLITVSVTKAWSDNNDSAGVRPSSVQATLTAHITNPDTTTTPVVLDNSITTTVTLRSTSGANNGDNWTYTWEGLPKYDSNRRTIEYEVEEVPLTGNLAIVYSSVVTESALNDNEFTITNTYTAPTEKINYQVNKVWSDNNNANGKRPTSLKFEIYNTGTNTKVAQYTITTASESSHIFELDKYDAQGNVIVYEAREVEVNTDDLKFYVATGGTLTNGTVSGNPGYISTFTNTFTVPNDTVSIVANKVWADSNNQNNRRPASIKFVVSKPNGNGTTAVANYTLTTANESSYTFTNLPKYDSQGNEITYILTEEEVNTDDLKFYTTQISNGTTVGSTTTYTVTNTFTVPNDQISIVATKVWSDNSDSAHKRPASVTIKLMRGQTQVATDVASSSNSWTVTFSNLAKYDSTTGADITYTLDEAEVNTDDLKFYTLTSSTVTPPANGNTYTGTITNTFTVPDERISVPVTKVWEDNSNANSTRLSAIDLTLTGNGQTYTQRLTSSNVDPTNSNNWKYTFTNLPKYDSNGDEITYVLSETAVTSGDLNGYLSSVSGHTVTNTEIIKGIEVEKTGTSIIYSKDDTVSYTIGYTAEVDMGYTGNSTITIVDTLPYEIDTSKTYSLDGGTYNSSAKTITWTGTYNPSTNRITWSDNTTTNLSAQIGTTNTITVTKNVSLVFADIDLTETSMTNEVEGRITLANGAELDAEDDLTTTIYFKRNIIVNKVWRGDTGANTRPETIRIQIKNGNTLVEQHTINSSMNWTDTFTNLPKYDTTTGNEITYTITENPVPSGYYVNIAEDTSAGAIASKTTPNDLVYTVTNSKYGSIHITKVDKADNTIKLGGAELRLSKLKYENNEWVVDNTFSPVTQITSSANATLGETTFSNLEYGKYRLEETVAPTGYNLLRSAVDIDVTEALPDYSANVENLHKTVLPATGGEYKVIIAIAGIAMIMTAVHINNKKKLKARMK